MAESREYWEAIHRNNEIKRLASEPERHYIDMSRKAVKKRAKAVKAYREKRNEEREIGRLAKERREMEKKDGILPLSGSEPRKSNITVVSGKRYVKKFEKKHGLRR